jgi:hypothetical protein
MNHSLPSHFLFPQNNLSISHLLLPDHPRNPKIHAEPILLIETHRKIPINNYILHRRIHEFDIKVENHGRDGEIQLRVRETIGCCEFSRPFAVLMLRE